MSGNSFSAPGARLGSCFPLTFPSVSQLRRRHLVEPGLCARGREPQLFRLPLHAPHQLCYPDAGGPAGGKRQAGRGSWAARRRPSSISPQWRLGAGLHCQRLGVLVVAGQMGREAQWVETSAKLHFFGENPFALGFLGQHLCRPWFPLKDSCVAWEVVITAFSAFGSLGFETLPVPWVYPAEHGLQL